MKSHYETLSVSPSANNDEIKKAYRALCLKHHPDLSKTKTTSNAELFKQISAAYSVLSDRRTKKIYDLELEEFRKFGRYRRQGKTGGTRSGPGNTQTPNGMAYRFHVLDGIYKPRNLILGLSLGFATVAFLKASLGIQRDESTRLKNKKEDGKKKLVEAYYNSKLKRWEKPTPWSKSFRELNPEIKLVPRDQVHSSNE